jgi:hypothetical protein
MQSRIRFAAAALAAMTVIGGVMTSSAGASTTNWNVKASGGAIDLTLLGSNLEIGGGLTEADANSGNVAEAMGTGLCINGGNPAVSCPTDVTSPGGASFETTQKAIQNGANGQASPAPAGSSACAAPIPPTPLGALNLGCGDASASEANGLPTAEGDGSLLDGQLTVSMGSALGANNVANNVSCSGNPTAPASSTGTPDTSQLNSGLPTTLLGPINSVLANLPTPVPPLVNVADPTSTPNSVCSELSGLRQSVLPQLGAVPGLNELTQLLGGGMANAANAPLLEVTAIKGSSTVASPGSLITATGSTAAADVNVMGGMLDIKVVPSVATASVNQSTGAATANCTPGIIEVTANGMPNLVSGQPLGDAINTILGDLYSTPLSTLLMALLGAQSNTQVLSCNAPTVSGSNSASVNGDIAKATVLPVGPLAPTGLVGIKVGDVTAEASSASSSAVANPTTQPNTTPTGNAPATPGATPVAVPAAAPAAVPNVTSVHTGEFWAGTLPIILMIGMALAGSLLIGRRRVAAFARNLPLISRRWGSH